MGVEQSGGERSRPNHTAGRPSRIVLRDIPVAVVAYGVRLRAGIQVGSKDSRAGESDDEWVTQIFPSVRAKTGGEAGRAWNWDDRRQRVPSLQRLREGEVQDHRCQVPAAVGGRLRRLANGYAVLYYVEGNSPSVQCQVVRSHTQSGIPSVERLNDFRMPPPYSRLNLQVVRRGLTSHSYTPRKVSE